MTEDDGVTLNHYVMLTKDFPAAAYSVDGSRGFDLSSVKAHWIVERLNEVFGWNGWSFEPDFHVDEKRGVWCEGSLHLGKKDTHTVRGVGASNWKTGGSNSIGDTFKSAMTDCLGKCAARIGVANAAHKGLVDPKDIKSGNVGTASLETREAILSALALVTAIKKKEGEKGFDPIESFEAVFKKSLAEWGTPELDQILKWIKGKQK